MEIGQKAGVGDATAAQQELIINAVNLFNSLFTTTIGTFLHMVETKFDVLHADVATTIAALIEAVQTKLDTLHADLTITTIDSILEISVNDSTWQAITVPAAGGSACKAIAATLLAETVWHFSHESDGDPSIKVNGTLTLDIVKGASDVIGYAQTDSGSDTLQVVLLK